MAPLAHLCPIGRAKSENARALGPAVPTSGVWAEDPGPDLQLGRAWAGGGGWGEEGFREARGPQGPPQTPWDSPPFFPGASPAPLKTFLRAWLR